MILYIVSVGLSVTMGLMGFVNLAHGVFAMAGGYVTVRLMNAYAVPFGLALLVAFVAVALLSVVLERTLYARLYGAGELEQVLFTIGLIFMSVAIVRYLWGPSPQPVHLPAVLSGQIDLGIRSFPTYRTFLIVVGLRADRAALAGRRAHQFRCPVARRCRQSAHGGIDRHRHAPAVLARLRPGLRACRAGRRTWRRHPGDLSRLRHRISRLLPDGGRRSAASARCAARSSPRCCSASATPPANIWCRSSAPSSSSPR